MSDFSLGTIWGAILVNAIWVVVNIISIKRRRK